MDTQLFLERLGLLLKRNLIVLLLLCGGVILFGYGLYMSFTQDKEPGVVIEKASSQDNAQTKMFIDIEGAVNKPGVYELSHDSRIQDALIAAGGLSQDADRVRIAQTVNLAGKLTDGAKLYFPFKGESSVSSGTSGQALGEVEGSTSSLINVNTASSSELESLKGIGEVTAQKIIDSRPYTSVDELLQKKILKTNVYEDIKDEIIVY